jgi:hypothetical protein
MSSTPTTESPALYTHALLNRLQCMHACTVYVPHCRCAYCRNGRNLLCLILVVEVHQSMQGDLGALSAQGSCHRADVCRKRRA